jgi:hypothetical protein
MKREVQDYMAIIHHTCKSFSSLLLLDSALEFADLLGEAFVAFCELTEDEMQNALNCQFSTALVNKIKARLINIYNHLNHPKRKAVKEEFTDNTAFTEMQNKILFLDKTEREIAEILINPPPEFASIQARNINDALAIYFKRKYAWPKTKTESFLKKIV